MKQSTSTVWTFLPVLLATNTMAFADSWTCQKGDLTRQVLIVYPEKPALLPCEVFYSKPTENVVPRALWQAANNEGYCERKAAEFVVKLESWGWRCGVDPQQASSSGPATQN
ncbi:MAG: hypothetical protein QNJ91_07780 [Gammaproteobacteria bacterium]|nr:hypothetical protein [Gammaproteobacteria bacterium]